MAEWIEINRPYRMSLNESSELTNNLHEELNDLYHSFNDEVNKQFNIDIQSKRNEVESLLEKSSKQVDKITHLSVEEFKKEIKKIHDSELNQKRVSKEKELNKYIDWIEQQPEFLNKSAKIHEKYDKLRAQQSFAESSLNKPGVLIEVEFNDEIKQYLIGDINIHSGICDDCRAFEDDAIVKRCRVVWE